MTDGAYEKQKKRNEQKRSREADAQKKKLTKQVERNQPTDNQKPKEFTSKAASPASVEKTDAARVIRSQEENKPVDKKLREGSVLRKKLLRAKTKREVSEKERAIDKSVRDDKQARQSNRIQEQATSRETLAKQQQGLQSEIKALNKLESVKESSGTEYTARFSGFQSAIAAGPMGAASTGLRKLDPAMLINMAREEIGARVQKKLDPKIALKMEQLRTIARSLKVGNLKEIAPKAMPSAHAEKEPDAAIKRIVNSKLRMKIREAKDKLKEPNRNPSKFDELNMPFRGVGGVGGI